MTLDHSASYDDHIASLGRKARIRANIAAIRTVRQLASEERAPEEADRAVLDRFTGWGGIADAFDHRPGNAVPAELREELRVVLGDAEWNAAAAATLTSFHTPRRIAAAMASGLAHLGYAGGRLLYPGAGTGAMLACLPADLAAATHATAVECNATVAAIARHLHPLANVVASRLEDANLPDGFFDAALGNLPFADVFVSDRRYRGLSPLLHDYMLLRTVDLLRPGGIAIAITSRGFLDKRQDKVRDAVCDRASLVAAFRLPNTAFHRHSKTRVVADVLVLQRRPELLSAVSDDLRDMLIAAQGDWRATETLFGCDGEVRVNRYFRDHPEHVLGDMGVASGPYGATLDVTSALDDAAIADRLLALFQDLPGGILPARFEEPGASVPMPRPSGAPLHILGEAAGEVLRWEVAGYTPLELPDADRRRLCALLSLRDALRRAIELQGANASGAERAAARGALRARHAAFVSAHGRVRDARNAFLLANDPDYTLLSALEVQTATGIRDADILHRPLGDTNDRGSAVSTVEGAIATSLDRFGRVDLDYVATVLGLDGVAEAEALAGDRIYSDPALREWVPADEYLSGDVRGKLDTARAAAAADPAFARNVAALEAVLPAAVSFAEIDAKLGASWIPTADYEAFAASLLTASGSQRPIAISRNPLDSSYELQAEGRVPSLVQAKQTWGTARRPFHRLLDLILNNSPIVVRDRLEDGSSVVNLQETEDAQAKAKEIEEVWRDWVWQDPARRDRLAAVYNELMNREVPPVYDGSHLGLTGLAEEWRERVRPAQRNAAWRIIRHGSALVGHEMSVGKTLTLVIAALEARRLGRAARPLLAVKSATLHDIVTAARAYYPDARIVALPERATAARRRAFLAEIATGDVDLAITSHDAFDRIAIRPATEMRVIEEQIADHREALHGLDDEDPAQARTTRQIEKALKRLETRLERLAEPTGRDEILYYEDLAIDLLMIDEAHRYKSLPVVTRDGGLKGVPRNASQRALHLYMAAHATAEVNRRAGRRGRGLVLATGTPLTNTIPEAYTLQRYLQPEVLEARGIAHFDAWMRVFAEAETRVEMTVSGDYRLTTRLCKFTNLPELARMVSPIFDIVFAEDVSDLRRPIRQQQVVAVPPSPALRSVMAWIKERAGLIIASSNDNMLAICSDGRKAALDPRLVVTAETENAGAKLRAAAENIARIARDNPGSVQLVFLDIGLHPVSTSRALAEAEEGEAEPQVITALDGASSTQFCAREELVRLLGEHGVDGSRVADIVATQGKGRQRAVRSLRRGTAVVGIGSTETLGTGLNVQDRIIAIHHVDAPWLPSSLDQRDARGIRHGNANEEVFIYRYVTVGSFDTFMWQVIDTKARFIRQFLDACRGRSLDSLAREIRDEDASVLSPGQVMAIAAGNPLLLRRAELQDRVKRFERARLRAERARVEARVTRDHLTSLIASLEAEAVEAKVAEQHALSLRETPFSLAVLDDRGEVATTSTKRTGAAEHLARRVLHLEHETILSYRRRTVPVARLGDFVLTAAVVPHGRKFTETRLYVSHEPSGEGLRSREVAWDSAQEGGAGRLASLERRIAQYVDLPGRLAEELAEARQNLASVEALTTRADPKGDELQQATDDLKRVERILSLPDADPDAVDALRGAGLDFAELNRRAERAAAVAASLAGDQRAHVLAEAAACQALADELDPAARQHAQALDRPVCFPAPSRALLDLPVEPDDEVAPELLALFTAA